MSRSGSKRPAPAPPPELLDWQLDVLDRVARSKLASEVTFGGGAALAALYLHHRASADVDLFLKRELEPGELRPLSRSLTETGVTVNQATAGPRRSLILLRGREAFGRIDFAYYPYDPIDRAVRWRGLVVDSLVDMTVNKVQAILTRFQPRDFVDLCFLLREGPERDPERLLGLVRAKFDVGADRLELAKRFLLADEIAELPPLIRPLPLAELRSFFEDAARDLARRG